jgi:hypothetical protein
MTDDVAGWLASEVSDLLAASSVGLYEFLWLARGAYPDAAEEQLRSWAAAALGQLLERSDVQLVLLLWPSDSVVQDATSEPTPADWEDPKADEPYMALRMVAT